MGCSKFHYGFGAKGKNGDTAVRLKWFHLARGPALYVVSSSLWVGSYLEREDSSSHGLFLRQRGPLRKRRCKGPLTRERGCCIMRKNLRST